MKYKCEICGKESTNIRDITSCEMLHKKEKACEIGRVYTISIKDNRGYYDDIFQAIVYEKTEEETKICGISKFGLMYLTLKDDEATITGNEDSIILNYSVSGEYSTQPSAYMASLNLIKNMCENSKTDLDESIKQIDFLIDLVKKYIKY